MPTATVAGSAAKPTSRSRERGQTQLAQLVSGGRATGHKLCKLCLTLFREALRQQQPIPPRAAHAAAAIRRVGVIAPVDVAAHGAEDATAGVLRDQERVPRLTAGLAGHGRFGL